jgi:methane monooxygenase component C
MYTIYMYFEDDEEMQFECEEGEDLITASLRQEIILMSECREGLCTTCKVLCEEGDYEHGDGVNVQSLPPEEEEEGHILMCQAYPQSDLELAVPYTSDRVTLGVAIPSKSYDAAVVACEQLTENVMRLELRVQTPFGVAEEWPFMAGQYTTVNVPGTEEWRSYSMANVADDSGKIELLIRLMEDGCMSEYLSKRAKVGDAFELKGPFGAFNLHAPEDRSRYFVAGSTGLAPLMSMLRSMNTEGDTTPAHLLFGARSQDFLFFEEEINQLADSMSNLQVHLALEDTSGCDCWTGACCNVVELLDTVLKENNETPDIYICGPAGMVTAVEEMARKHEVPTKHVHVERFVAS